MFSFVMRQPFAILGAIGLLSVLKSFLTFHEDVAAIINAYQVVTRGAWDFLFGWLYVYIPISVPGWVKDYFSMGLICFSAGLRSISILPERIYIILVPSYILSALTWPISLPYYIYAITETGAKEYFRESKRLAVGLMVFLLDKKLHQFNKEEKNELRYMLGETKIQIATLRIYLDFVCWAIAIICINYSLFFADSIK